MSAPGRVLLVEDDAGLVDAYRIVLDARGFEIRTAGTAEAALARIEDAPPDAVVADLGLPDLEGPDLIRRLRRAAPGARLLVLTGEAGDDLRRRCADAGADRFLVKPVSGGDLAAELETG